MSARGSRNARNLSNNHMRPALTHCHGSPPWTTRLRLGLGWRPTIVRVTMSSSVIRVASSPASRSRAIAASAEPTRLSRTNAVGAYDDCVSGREATAGPSYRC